MSGRATTETRYWRTSNVVADHSDQMQLWDNEANAGADPSRVGARSSHRVHWKCPVAEDHRWSAPPSVIARSLEAGFTGCPFCAGRQVSVTNSFAAKYPDAVHLWHPTRNGELTAEGLLAGTARKVWWQCPIAPDHEWQTAPVVLGKVSLSKGNSGCPFCAGKRPSVTNSVAAFPELADEWHPTRNGDLRPENAVASAPRKYWWRCRVNPGHEWQASGANRVRGRRCPFCKKSLRSVLEVGLAYELMDFFPDLDLSDDKVVLDGVVTQVDLLIRSQNLVIEVDGRFHHGQDRYPVRDRVKSDLLVGAGYRLMRVREAPLLRVTEADVLIPADSTIKQTTDAVLSRLVELGWASIPSLPSYLADPAPRRIDEALAHVQEERPGQRIRVPGPVVMPRASRWERGLRLARQFADREGHARVPDAHVEDGVELGAWVGLQRKRYSRGTLERDRVERLETLPGWSWSAVEDEWEVGYTHLLAFLERERHIEVPSQYREPDGFPLGSWVRSHRRPGGRRTMSEGQQKRLEAVPGWTFQAPMEGRWERAAAAMEVFAAREGHCRTPDRYREAGVELDSWCARQRGLHHRGRLAPARVARLEAIPGWSWRPQEHAWERGYQALLSMAESSGSAAVRGDSNWQGYPVGAWVSEQRHRRTELPDGLRERLEALPGWSWSVLADSWDRHIRALEAFTQREGHAAVPTGHVESGLSLGSWVIRNRAEYRRGILSEERVGEFSGVQQSGVRVPVSVSL